MIIPIIDRFRVDLHVDLRVKRVSLCRDIAAGVYSVSHSEHGCDFEEIVNLIVDEVVLDYDGLVPAGEVLLLRDLAHEVFLFVEFANLSWFQDLGVHGFDLLDLSELLVEVADLVKDHSVDGVALSLLFTDSQLLGFFHFKAWITDPIIIRSILSKIY